MNTTLNSPYYVLTFTDKVYVQLVYVHKIYSFDKIYIIIDRYLVCCINYYTNFNQNQLNRKSTYMLILLNEYIKNLMLNNTRIVIQIEYVKLQVKKYQFFYSYQNINTIHIISLFMCDPISKN